MIKIVRDPLPEAVIADLDRYSAQIRGAEEPQGCARDLWKHTTVRRRVRVELDRALRRMAPGRDYCMYCGDNLGTDIDHFEPITRNPLRTFDWLNHLLTCSHCNSHVKRDRFPVDAEGQPLLIDPTAEDPFEHLLLSFSTGEYAADTPKGEATIEVCGLNSGRLPEGRMDAALALRGHLDDWARADLRGDQQAKDELVRLIWNRPLVDVCQSMLRQAHSDGLKLVFDPAFVDLLRRPTLRAALLR